ncbi:MAG: dTDP-4-amino-4,6-dideoxygalactose transaminase [Nitrososphaera sp.]|nr:dTDP-4-amino-4,6-dideoxygalactose transaminase [Nitrososphaera sp.]
MENKIPFNKPHIIGRELDYIAGALQRREIFSDGFFSETCSLLLEERLDIKKVLLTNSCTSALEMAAMLCQLEPGDEVIMPSYTFVSTANSFVRLGATPVFVDIRADTLNLDESQVEKAITRRTKAITAVHYAGVACEMDTICEIARRYDLCVIEDAAQAVNSFYGSRALGSIGDLGAFSFHETKNYTCGEGGALCINNPAFIERAEIIREKGTNRKQFFRGKVDKYTWVDVGSSYIPSEITAAFLLAQLEMLDEISERRRRIYEAYWKALQPLERLGVLRLPRIPARCISNSHMFYIIVKDEQTRDGLIAYLRAQNIFAASHYVPLHTSPMGRNVGLHQKRLPVTEELSGHLLRLPFYCDLSEQDQARVVGAVFEFLGKKNVHVASTNQSNSAVASALGYRTGTPPQDSVR